MMTTAVQLICLQIVCDARQSPSTMCAINQRRGEGERKRKKRNSCAAQCSKTIMSSGKSVTFNANEESDHSTDGVSSPTIVADDLDASMSKSLDISLANSDTPKNSGSVYAWGWNINGQLGVGDTITRIRPQLVPNISTSTAFTEIKKIVCGSRFTIALTNTGQIFSWGRGDDGQLGHGSKKLTVTPSMIGLLASTKIVDVDTRGSHVVAVDSDGFAYSWGRGDDGQLGHGDRQNKLEPKRIQNLKYVYRVICSRLHSIALTHRRRNHSRRLYTWGCSDDGATGHGSSNVRCYAPMEIKDFRNQEVLDIACGSRHTMLITKGGGLYTWGSGIYGQLGLGNTANVYSPTKLSIVDNGIEYTATKVECGYRHSFCVVHRKRTPTLDESSHPEEEKSVLFAWGWNQYYQLGFTSPNAFVTSPTLVEFSLQHTILKVAGGGRHTLCVALKNAGESEKSKTYSWGRGDDGQLGIAEVSTKSHPIEMKTLPKGRVSQIACGWSHSAAVVDMNKRVLHRLVSVAVDGGNALGGPGKGSTFARKICCCHCIRGVWYDPRQYFVLRDLDGLASQFLGAVTQLILMLHLMPQLCNMSSDIVLRKVIPGCGLAYFSGNFFFWIQAVLMSKHEKRIDVTAQINGINTILFYAYLLLVMKPEYDRNKDTNKALAADSAWAAGCFAGFMTGLLELVSVPIVKYIRLIIPRAAMMSAVAGVSLVYITLNFIFEIYQSPSYALFPMLFLIILLGSNTMLPFNLPVGLTTLVLGTILAWVLKGLNEINAIRTFDVFTPDNGSVTFAFNVPIPQTDVFAKAFNVGWRYMPIIFPMYLVQIINNMANIETAHKVGDKFPVWKSMLANSIITMVSAFFGNPFPTSIFIGQSAFKASGIRSGYAFLSAVILLIICVSGSMSAILKIVPLAAGVGFLMWIGVLVTKQAFEKDSNAFDHGLAVVVGLIPPISTWALGLITSTISASISVLNSTGANLTLTQISKELSNQGVYIYGIMSLSQGYLIISIILSATLCFVLDRKFNMAALWMLIAAFLSFFGIIHSFKVDETMVTPVFGVVGVTPDIDQFVATYTTVYLFAALFCMILYIKEQNRSWKNWLVKIRKTCASCRKCRCKLFKKSSVGGDLKYAEEPLMKTSDSINA